VARVLAWSTWAPVALLSVFLPSSHGADLVWRLVFLAFALFFLVRSLFFGIYLRDGNLIVVSWFRTYRVQSAEIECLLERIYIGMLTNGDLGVSLFSSRFRIVGVRRSNGRDKLYPVTVMTNRRCKAVVRTLEERLSRTSMVVTL
jgi:hypothetical protein